MSSSDSTPKAPSLIAIGSAVLIVQPGDAFCNQHGVVVGVKGGGWYDVKLDVSGAVQKCVKALPPLSFCDICVKALPPLSFCDILRRYRPGMFVFSSAEMQQSYLQRSRKSPKSGPLPSPSVLPPSACSPVLAPLQQELCNLGIKYIKALPPLSFCNTLRRYISPPSIASSAATPHMGGSCSAGGGAAVHPPPLLLDDHVSPKFIRGTSIILQPPPLHVREDECESLYATPPLTLQPTHSFITPAATPRAAPCASSISAT